MKNSIHRYLLLATGAILGLIGLAYCVDPNLLLARYDLAVSSVSEDNMYRGAYGGLFIALGAAMAYGFFAPSFRRMSTLVAVLFMGGFAVGRLSSIVMVGMPHEQIIGLFLFELISTGMFAYFLYAQRSRPESDGIVAT